MTPSVSTHVLDTERGEPVNGVRVELNRRDVLLSTQETDRGGRIADLVRGALEPGTYRPAAASEKRDPARQRRTGWSIHDHNYDHQAVLSDLTPRVKALESLLVEKGLVDPAALLAREEAWAEASRRTPHGKPVELKI